MRYLYSCPDSSSTTTPLRLSLKIRRRCEIEEPSVFGNNQTFHQGQRVSFCECVFTCPPVPLRGETPTRRGKKYGWTEVLSGKHQVLGERGSHCPSSRPLLLLNLCTSVSPTGPLTPIGTKTLPHTQTPSENPSSSSHDLEYPGVPLSVPTEHVGLPT